MRGVGSVLIDENKLTADETYYKLQDIGFILNDLKQSGEKFIHLAAYDELLGCTIECIDAIRNMPEKVVDVDLAKKCASLAYNAGYRDGIKSKYQLINRLKSVFGWSK